MILKLSWKQRDECVDFFNLSTIVTDYSNDDDQPHVLSAKTSSITLSYGGDVNFEVDLELPEHHLHGPVYIKLDFTRCWEMRNGICTACSISNYVSDKDR